MAIIIIIIVAIILFVLFFKLRKVPKLGDLTTITGGIKTGKSTLAIFLARRKYKFNLFIWKIKKVLCKIFHKKIPEKPLFYSNIKLTCEYVPMTKEIFLREERLAYKSVSYVNEASLIADSQDWKDKNINEKLKLFNKLYGHETKGGSLYYDTQAIKDVHYSIKRCMNNYLWIHHAIKWIPFIYIVKVREMLYVDENTINLNEKDGEDNLKYIIIPKKIWKTFDCYTYSCFTDNLPVANKVTKNNKKDLKTNYIINLKE